MIRRVAQCDGCGATAELVVGRSVPDGWRSLLVGWSLPGPVGRRSVTKRFLACTDRMCAARVVDLTYDAPALELVGGGLS